MNRFDVSGSKSLEKTLKDYMKRYFNNTTSDFSDFGFNSMLLGILSHVGEKLMFYQDYYMNERFLTTANDLESILKHAARENVKFIFGGVATGEVTFYIDVPAGPAGPDLRYVPILRAGCVLYSDNNVFFTLQEDVIFNVSEYRVGSVNTETGSPTSYILSGVGNVISGRIVEEKVEIKDFEPFKKIYFGDSDVAEVVSVVDSSGNTFYEVDNLSQNIIFKTDKSGSSYPMAVPYRFVLGRDINGFFLQFGSGSDNVNFREVLDDVQKHVGVSGKSYSSIHSFDPYCLVYNDKFGIAPENTVLTIRYRTIEQSNINVGVGGITKIIERTFDFDYSVATNIDIIEGVSNSLECFNSYPIVGYMLFDNNEELKTRIIGATRSQRRAVSLEDYVAIVYNMPKKFGSIKRCSVSSSFIGDRVFVNIYVASMDENRKLVATNDVIKKNLYEWVKMYKIISDNINIFDLNIVNLGLEYAVSVDYGYNKNDVNRKCEVALREKFKYSLEGGQSLDLTEIYKILISIPGVIDVSYLNVTQKMGDNYSNFEYDLFSHLTPDGKVILAEPHVVFEFKYILDDIRGYAR